MARGAFLCLSLNLRLLATSPAPQQSTSSAAQLYTLPHDPSIPLSQEQRALVSVSPIGVAAPVVNHRDKKGSLP